MVGVQIANKIVDGNSINDFKMNQNLTIPLLSLTSSSSSSSYLNMVVSLLTIKFDNHSPPLINLVLRALISDLISYSFLFNKFRV
jgi:hypothetical protein